MFFVVAREFNHCLLFKSVVKTSLVAEEHCVEKRISCIAECLNLQLISMDALEPWLHSNTPDYDVLTPTTEVHLAN